MLLERQLNSFGRISTLLSGVDSVWTLEFSESHPLEVFHYPDHQEENARDTTGRAVLVGEAAHVIAVSSSPRLQKLSKILKLSS